MGGEECKKALPPSFFLSPQGSPRKARWGWSDKKAPAGVIMITAVQRKTEYCGARMAAVGSWEIGILERHFRVSASSCSADHQQSCFPIVGPLAFPLSPPLHQPWDAPPYPNRISPNTFVIFPFRDFSLFSISRFIERIFEKGRREDNFKVFRYEWKYNDLFRRNRSWSLFLEIDSRKSFVFKKKKKRNFVRFSISPRIEGKTSERVLGGIVSRKRGRKVKTPWWPRLLKNRGKKRAVPGRIIRGSPARSPTG